MRDPFDEHCDQMEHELDSDHAPIVQNDPWLNQHALSGPALGQDVQSACFCLTFNMFQ